MRLAPVVAVACGLAVVAVSSSASAAPPQRPRSYAKALTLSYAIPIGIDAAALGAFATTDIAKTGEFAAYTAFVGIPLPWLAPGVVHTAYGQPVRGLVATGATALSFVAGLAIGLPLVAVVANATHDDEHPYGTAPAWAMWAGFGLLGETAWGIIDVNMHSSLPPEQTSERTPALQLVGLSLVPRREGGAMAWAALCF